LQSDLLLDKALKEMKKKESKHLMAEILLAKSINAYFQNRDHEFSLLVEHAKIAAPDHPFIPFYKGIDHYLKRNYSETLQCWSSFSPPSEKKWLSTLTDILFPTPWRELHIAHCLAEKDEIEKSRSILEKQSHTLPSHDPNLQNLAALFLGFTYLKEGETMPSIHRNANYRLACFYFDRAGSLKHYVREQKYVTDRIQTEAVALLDGDLTEEQHQCGLNFIHTVQEWRFNHALQVIADQLALKILDQSPADIIPLCQLIRQKFEGSPFHTLLTEKLLTSIAKKLRENHGEKLFDLWIILEALSTPTKLAHEQLATLTYEEIFDSIRNEEAKIAQIRHYLAFWKKLKKNSLEHKQLAYDLLWHAKLLWQKEGSEKKAEQLMEIALNLSKGDESLQRDVENFLVELYVQAENSNLIERLTLIYETMEHFKITKQKVVYPCQIANYLADALYFYEVRNYFSAKTHATWVLKLSPQNEEALWLAGLSAFHLGEYSTALSYLQQLSSPDKYARKALIISKVFASQPPAKHLAQIDQTDSFEEE
ncbi:MAG: DUF1347 family protein, partial [Chlamydiales bacterium]